eukprot:3477254-Prymnesium_polylepis.1
MVRLVSPPRLDVSIRALHSAPPTSISTYLGSVARLMRIFAVVSWAVDPSPDSAGFVIEGRARSEAADATDTAAWDEDWQVAATVDGSTSSYLFELEPGLEYSYRVAEMSGGGGGDGGRCFSEACAVSVLSSDVQE